MANDSLARALALAAMNGTQGPMGPTGPAGANNNLIVDFTWIKNETPEDMPANFPSMMENIYAQGPSAFNLWAIWGTEACQCDVAKDKESWTSSPNLEFAFRVAADFTTIVIGVTFNENTGAYTDATKVYEVNNYNDAYHPGTLPDWSTPLYASYSNGTLDLYDHDPNE